MNIVIETLRLLLRPLVLSDADAFFEMNNNPNVNLYLRNHIITKTDAAEYVQKIIGEYQKNGIARFAVILKENNKLIGFSGIKYRDTLENNHVDFYDLGYRFAEAHWRKGFATEATLAWLDYGFNTMNLSTIYATAISENIGSNAVLQKLGFEFTNQYLVNHTPYNWYQMENKNFKK